MTSKALMPHSKPTSKPARDEASSPPDESSLALDFAGAAVQSWFARSFEAPTAAQALVWPKLAAHESVLLLAPTGSGKTLAAFLVALDRLLYAESPLQGTRVLYISPLKALGIDVEKNLRVPLEGIRGDAARSGETLHPVSVGVRSGDTPQRDRARLVKEPPSILITTPESLYLMLTSRARETLREVDTVIVDEIHAVSGTKRGAHLFASLERLEALRTPETPLQRIGLSATQRPLQEVARLLGGFEENALGKLAPRPIAIVQAPGTKRLSLSVEVPMDDMSQLGGDDASEPSQGGSIWPLLHPRVLRLIREHRSTMVFTNSRRLAERLAGAINELAGEELVLAHHGSIAKERRALIEERLKQGDLKAIIATSSLELGIDMGAVDLVIQIEAPSSIASGIQRVGRAGHSVGAVSRGVFFPKFRGDLVATAAAAECIRAGSVEETYYPRNPLDVLAQQIVAHVATEPSDVDSLWRLLRRAAPFAELPKSSFESVLDMLCGRYPSERFRELRARLIWDRRSGALRPRRGARLLAITNGGTIVDRGLYGVFLSGTDPAVRVGELDEEMVFEARVGDVFLLGASSWRIDEISRDRVLVSPAPGEPGQMPFWRGERPGRSLAFGTAIGKLLARLSGASPDDAGFSPERYALDERSASNLEAYVKQQGESSLTPTHERIVVECFVDEVGDWRVVVLSPFGGRVHAPWTLAVNAIIEQKAGVAADCTWSDDGMVFRLPQSDEPPPLEWFVPDVQQAERNVEGGLLQTSLFAAHFRECAARALLLPRRRPGKRTPLWVQARRAKDLLAVAREFEDFPIVLEAYRECLRDVFDMKGFLGMLSALHEGTMDAEFVLTKKASPFASALLFSYVANFIYDNDTPPAERRAQMLSLDREQLRQLMGDPELRTLLDSEAIERVERGLLRLDGAFPIENEDDVYDLLWELGDVSTGDVALRVVLGRERSKRSESADATVAEGARPNPQAPGSNDGAASNDDALVSAGSWLETLTDAGRIVALQTDAGLRYVVAEDVCRYRDVFQLDPKEALPSGLLESVADPLGDLVLRFAKTHRPFTLQGLADRFRVLVPTERQDAAAAADASALRHTLERLAQKELVVRGEFIPGGSGEEWCHSAVLSRIKQQSMLRARREAEPVPRQRYAEFLLDWHGIVEKQSGLDGILNAVERLMGLEVPLEDLERDVLPARVVDYRQGDLDELCVAGELSWCAAGSEAEPKVRLFLADHRPLLLEPPEPLPGEFAARIRALLRRQGALFFSDLQAQLGGFETDLFNTLWQMVWCSELTNDTLAPLRSLMGSTKAKTRFRPGLGYRSRRSARPGTEGRWSLLYPEGESSPTNVEKASARAKTLLFRHGIVTRESVGGEPWSGGFAAVYPVLRAMEDAGSVRRGYFIEGLGGAQFAFRGAEGRLRSKSNAGGSVAAVLCASDPANAYGWSVPWPRKEGARLQRAAGAHVVVWQGRLLAYVGKHKRAWTLFIEQGGGDAPDEDGDEAQLLAAVDEWFDATLDRAWLIESIDGQPASASRWAARFARIGFTTSSQGLQKRRDPRGVGAGSG